MWLLEVQVSSEELGKQEGCEQSKPFRSESTRECIDKSEGTRAQWKQDACNKCLGKQMCLHLHLPLSVVYMCLVVFFNMLIPFLPGYLSTM